jgi:hypothetical protein
MSTRLLSITAFLVGFALVGVVEVASRRSRVPSLGDVCGVVMRYRVGPLPVGRIAMLGFWWWLGWHLFAR